MTWTFTERATSGKFSFSDDGSAKGTISVAATRDGSDPAPAGASSSSGSLLSALKDYWPIGGTVSTPSTFSGWHSTWGAGDWKVNGYSGVVPGNSSGSCWYAEIHVSYVGDAATVQGAYLDADRPRRDCEVMIQPATRQANAYADWYSLDETTDIPADGDADWSSGSTDLKIDHSVRVDINGSPIMQTIPAVRVKVQVLEQYDPVEPNYISGTYVGYRNKSGLLGWAKGTLLFEGVDSAQIGHGFARNTYSFLGDLFSHLEQEPIVSPKDGRPLFESTDTTVDTFVIKHASAVWRQPYALTSATNAWDLDDIFAYSTAGVPTYLAALYA